FADWTRAAELTVLPTLAAQFHVRAGNLARDYLKDRDKALQSYARARSGRRRRLRHGRNRQTPVRHHHTGPTAWRD
ncbi:hypothetical protein, partial [Staphylococcus aureus]|uniref:hypothetical protein n=1 Tax=Staphylococcus aureus TaxID=1280 RepID=UPI001F2ED0CE